MSETELHLWYETELGKNVLASECAALDNWHENFYANSLLQLGGNDKTPFFQNRFKHINKIYCNRKHSLLPSNERLLVQGAYDALPFAPESIDLMVAFHTLDLAATNDLKKKMLQEMYDVLAPEGYAVIINFNPVSPWALWRKFAANRHLPKPKNLTFNLCLYYWMKQIGFTVHKQQAIFFRPPLQDSAELKRLLFLEGLGPLLFNNLGAVSIFFVQKRLPNLIRLSPTKLRQYLPIFGTPYLKPKPVGRPC